MNNLPQPYGNDWISWGRALVAVLTSVSRETKIVQLKTYTVATVPAATQAGLMIYVTDEAGGAVPAFSDGTNWRRVTDRAVIS